MTDFFKISQKEDKVRQNQHLKRSTIVKNVRQIPVPSTTLGTSFMQNKANFQKSQMDINLIITRNYDKKSNRTFGENKAKQTQFRLVRMVTTDAVVLDVNCYNCTKLGLLPDCFAVGDF